MFLLILFFESGWCQEADSLQSTSPRQGKLYFIPLPALSYNPAFGFIYGVAASGNILLGPPKDTRLSAGFLTATYSTKKQALFTLKTNIYSNHDRRILMGDWRVFLSSQPTYGLGTGPQSRILLDEKREEFLLGDYEDGIESAELMEFNLFRFHETVLFKVRPGFYLGAGYLFDKYWNIQDNLLDLEADIPYITNHYAYSVKHGFDPEGYIISGPGISVMYDTRDNVNSPYKGRYAFLQYKVFPTWMGNTRSATGLWLEYREYFSLSKKVPRNVFAIWTYFNLTTSGMLPYMGLPALGWDQLGRSGRAYPQGRFRGEQLFYFEAEYRFRIPLIKKNPDLFGGVVYANATSASAHDLNMQLFDYFKPGVGIGLRFMFQKVTRSNVTLDYGYGADGKGAIFFNMKEYY